MSILFTRFTLLVYLSLTCLPIRGENLYSLTTISGNTTPTAGWSLVNNNDGIDVYIQKKHNSDIHEVFVTTEISAPPGV